MGARIEVIFHNRECTFEVRAYKLEYTKRKYQRISEFWIDCSYVVLNSFVYILYMWLHFYISCRYKMRVKLESFEKKEVGKERKEEYKV